MIQERHKSGNFLEQLLQVPNAKGGLFPVIEL
jgi:hypothetical protein